MRATTVRRTSTGSLVDGSERRRLAPDPSVDSRFSSGCRFGQKAAVKHRDIQERPSVLQRPSAPNDHRDVPNRVSRFHCERFRASRVGPSVVAAVPGPVPMGPKPVTKQGNPKRVDSGDNQKPHRCFGALLACRLPCDPELVVEEMVCGFYLECGNKPNEHMMKLSLPMPILLLRISFMPPARGREIPAVILRVGH